MAKYTFIEYLGNEDMTHYDVVRSVDTDTFSTNPWPFKLMSKDSVTTVRRNNKTGVIDAVSTQGHYNNLKRILWFLMGVGTPEVFDGAPTLKFEAEHMFDTATEFMAPDENWTVDDWKRVTHDVKARLDFLHASLKEIKGESKAANQMRDDLFESADERTAWASSDQTYFTYQLVKKHGCRMVTGRSFSYCF